MDHAPDPAMSSIARQKILPHPDALERARKALHHSLPETGIGMDRLLGHILDDIVPGLNQSSLSPNYYGFVTGGVTRAAAFADNIVTEYDQNVQVHLPQDTVATLVEDAALRLLLSLFDLDQETWTGRTLTTGATASNVQGLACGRQYVIEQASRRLGLSLVSVAELGVIEACQQVQIRNINVLTTMPHSSLAKAAGILGLGRASVKDVGVKDGPCWHFDFDLLEKMLRLEHTASIVVVSCGEVNTGRFATAGHEEFVKLRALCDQYGAWIHVDAAFGLFAQLLPTESHDPVRLGVDGVELADSITGDAHKLLNVPYDCGFFFTRHEMHPVFHNPNAAYLNPSTADPSRIQSPLNISIENSRRFRALPVYATLIAYGRDGYVDMLTRQMQLARRVASFLLSHHRANFELLPHHHDDDDQQRVNHTFIIVLFRARDARLNARLVPTINATGRIYVSATTWQDRPATRIAVANWQVDPERDFRIIKEVLDEIVATCGRGDSAGEEGPVVSSDSSIFLPS